MPSNLPNRRSGSKHQSTKFLFKLGETDFVELKGPDTGPDTIQELMPDEEVLRLARSIAQRIPLDQVCRQRYPRLASLPTPTGQPRHPLQVPKPEPIAAIQPTRKLDPPPTPTIKKKSKKSTKSTFMRYMRLLPSVKELRHRPPPIPADDDSCNLYEEFRLPRSAPKGREDPEFRGTRSAPKGREEPEFQREDPEFSMVSVSRRARVARVSSHRLPPRPRSVLRSGAFLALAGFALALGIGLILPAPTPSAPTHEEVAAPAQGVGEKIHFTIKTEVQRSERPLASQQRSIVRKTRTRRVRSARRRSGWRNRAASRRRVDVDALLSAGGQPSGVSPDAILAAGRRAKRVTRRPRAQRLHLPRWAM